MRVLVIDDSRAMRFILKMALKTVATEVVEAANGREALDRLADKGPFELALVDWNMPVMNGLEFVAAARAKPELAEMRIVMVTTEVEMSQIVKALEAGANEYVMKPFTAEILLEKLSMVGLSA